MLTVVEAVTLFAASTTVLLETVEATGNAVGSLEKARYGATPPETVRVTGEPA